MFYSVNNYKGIPVPVLLLAVVAVVMAYAANNTRFGRYTYAIGGNREAARLSGINIKGIVFRVFVLMGFLCGVAGVVLASYVGYGTIAAGTGYELDAIAACHSGWHFSLGRRRHNSWCSDRRADYCQPDHRASDDECAARLAICCESDHPGCGSLR